MASVAPTPTANRTALVGRGLVGRGFSPSNALLVTRISVVPYAGSKKTRPTHHGLRTMGVVQT
jgi:hypothetical protein